MEEMHIDVIWGGDRLYVTFNMVAYGWFGVKETEEGEKNEESI